MGVFTLHEVADISPSHRMLQICALCMTLEHTVPCEGFARRHATVQREEERSLDCNETCMPALQDLQKAMEGLDMRTDLHLCYLITPCMETLCRDWQKIYSIMPLLRVSLHILIRPLMTRPHARA